MGRGVLGWFGLDADADERALKRAYAQKLKTVRPDEDPAGFQELRTRYEAALAWVRRREQPHDDDDEGEDAATPLVQIHVRQPEWQPTLRIPVAQAEPAEAPLDAQAFYEDFVARAAMDDERRLSEWLEAHPGLWSLDRKQAVGRWLVQRLHEDQPAIRTTLFDDTLRFFGLMQVQRDVDAAALLRLRRRVHLRYLLANKRQLFRVVGDGANDKRSEGILRQLTRPLRFVQAWWFGVRTGPAPVVNFLFRLDGGRLDLPPPIEPAQVQFFMQAANTSSLSWPRVAIGYTWAMALVWFVTMVMTIRHDAQWLANTLIDLAWSPAWAAAAYVPWLFVTVPLRWVFNWQAAPEQMPTRWPWLRFSAVPLLMVVMGLAWAITDNLAWVFVLSPFIAALAIYRFAKRGGHTLPALNIIYAVLGVVVCGLPPITLTLAIVLWMVDAFKNRSTLRFRNA